MSQSSPSRPKVAPFHAIGISRLAHALKAEGRSVIHMEFGQPSTGAPKPAIARAHAVLDADPMGYWESVPLKQAIAARYQSGYGIEVAPQRVIPAFGASGALVLAFTALFRPGDRIALARPGYPAYRNTLTAMHLEPVEIPCGPETRYQLTAAHIEALDPAPAGVIVASPANPTGTMLTADELAAIAEVCKRRGIRLISDEIYHGLCYAHAPATALAFSDEAVVVNSFSKFFSMAGWRLGWLVVPESEAEDFATITGNMFLTPPSLAQHAALAALEAEDELQAHVAVYRANRQLLLDRLPAMGISRIAPPDGAFYIYADIGHLTNDSLDFCRRLVRETGVALAPGIDFDPIEGQRFLRFSFAVSTPEVEEALQRLESWLNR
ncbi:pyridoxal phosphate-dependent aminotransferase [Pedomonas mirosovicensis]|uniref:pyridoxal phosphate-dependent aminotransferase n=1 Tax=Pedomonas mirosovicensis TaxID=2908641 RepID=UPI002169A899|nr:aminotransferase class I/II-fold pyridoxal phosphate-dependent enzyme [Pedomonas mirosovicensis]MCH8685412.1 aminotransferase class I/II-fold pyridoxal phosphate-dependent enzyme [Pedomonas mirosovicensis]